jgi:hypothetical protein
VQSAAPVRFLKIISKPQQDFVIVVANDVMYVEIERVPKTKNKATLIFELSHNSI